MDSRLMVHPFVMPRMGVTVMRDCPEINVCNYNDDDVSELNQWAVEAIDENVLLRDAVRRYANYQPLDLKTPHELQTELLAIAGATHRHQASIGDDSCFLCGRDLRDKVHSRSELPGRD